MKKCVSYIVSIIVHEWIWFLGKKCFTLHGRGEFALLLLCMNEFGFCPSPCPHCCFVVVAHLCWLIGVALLSLCSSIVYAQGVSSASRGSCGYLSNVVLSSFCTMLAQDKCFTLRGRGEFAFLLLCWYECFSRTCQYMDLWILNAGLVCLTVEIWWWMPYSVVAYYITFFTITRWKIWKIASKCTLLLFVKSFQSHNSLCCKRCRALILS